MPEKPAVAEKASDQPAAPQEKYHNCPVCNARVLKDEPCPFCAFEVAA